ncbi:hypothetical protein BRADI_3g50255v3 [Brachypodium distachyon]|uniref:Uncharacterized protein n=1 Tax=Brachypodium distachyon TaxID=15368 RepID=A0A2K2D4E8_BRADI|nr:hypothetical protein BRADI_3g50255v3 [Brachypodium distachyon]
MAYLSLKKPRETARGPVFHDHGGAPRWCSSIPGSLAASHLSRVTTPQRPPTPCRAENPWATPMTPQRRNELSWRRSSIPAGAPSCRRLRDGLRLRGGRQVRSESDDHAAATVSPRITTPRQFVRLVYSKVYF